MCNACLERYQNAGSKLYNGMGYVAHSAASGLEQIASQYSSSGQYEHNAY